MHDSSYQFLDCGRGRRLERFGGTIVDRPAPAATGTPALADSEWARADVAFHRDKGWSGAIPEPWLVSFGPAILGLRPASGGQLGFFPEHALVADCLDRIVGRSGDTSLRALNLFAYTGLATLRLAAHPAVVETVHVDASPASLKQARENAAVSGLGDARVRWLRDDVLSFMEREIRRGREYDIILADPPSYGRDKKGGEWNLRRDMGELLGNAARLLTPRPTVFCLTCHSEGWDGDALGTLVGGAMPVFGKVETATLALRASGGGAVLRCGYAVTASPAS